jgi:hypothetical protein
VSPSRWPEHAGVERPSDPNPDAVVPATPSREHRRREFHGAPERRSSSRGAPVAVAVQASSTRASSRGAARVVVLPPQTRALRGRGFVRLLDVLVSFLGGARDVGARDVQVAKLVVERVQKRRSIVVVEALQVKREVFAPSSFLSHFKRLFRAVHSRGVATHASVPDAGGFQTIFAFNTSSDVRVRVFAAIR